MKKYYRLLITFFCLAGFGIFLFFFGYLITTTGQYAQNTTGNNQSNYKYLFLKLTSKPVELIAQLENGKENSSKKQLSEKSNEQPASPVLQSNISEKVNENSRPIEITDSIYIMNEKWIQQVIQMNGCFDIYNDFIEKDWMKDHNFIIL